MCRALGVLIAAVIMATVCGPALGPRSAAAQAVSPEQQLADKYAPIVMLRQQSAPCDKDGEGYFPTTVDFLFNNPDVALKAKGDGKVSSDTTIKQGPTAVDLVNAGPDTYLDFPGNPRDPGCGYETYFKQKAAQLGLKPTTYARIYVDLSDHRLYLQYWFYYYFNDWNDTHESDWEGIALVFDAPTAAAALNQQPSLVAYNQHAGGETAHWNDAKLEKDGTHPVAYVSAGSHGTYYSADTMIGWGKDGAAFGCDNTTQPDIRTPLNVVLIPYLLDPNGPFAWLFYKGKWGQRDVAFFNGPSGPNIGDNWNKPSQWYRTYRATVLKVPGTKLVGVNTTDVFCALAKRGSQILIYSGVHFWTTMAILLGIIAVVALLVSRVWPFFMEALDIYGKELRTFLGIGIVAVPIGIAFNGLELLSRSVPPLDLVTRFFDNDNSGRLVSSIISIVLQLAATAVVVAPAVIYAMKEMRRGVRPGVVPSFRGALRRVPRLAGALFILVALLAALSVTVILIPVAVYVLVRMQFFSQAILFDDAPNAWAALRMSWNATRGHWWTALTRTLAFQLLATLPGPLSGIILLIIGGSNVQFSNVVSSFVYAAFIPIAYIGLSATYRRLKGQEIIEPFVVTHERDPLKAAAQNAAIAAAQVGTR